MTDPNRFTGLSCNVDETCTITQTIDCSMNGVGIPASPVTKDVNTGSVTISNSWTDLYNGADTANCNFDDCTLNH